MARIYETEKGYKVMGRKEPTAIEADYGITGIAFVKKGTKQYNAISEDIARIAGNQKLGNGYYFIDDRIDSIANVLGINPETGAYRV